MGGGHEAPPRRGLTSYQHDWTKAPRYATSAGGQIKATTKTFTKARRIGGSFAAAVDACNLAAGYEWDGNRWKNVRPIDVHVVSASFNQAKNVLAEAAEFLAKVDSVDPRYKANAKANSIEFACGGNIVAHPAKASSLRTYTGALLLDEFAFVQQQEDVWGAAKNIAAATLKEPRGYPVSLITTPWTHGGFAHRLFTSSDLPFQRQTVDIYAAKAAGFPIDVEQTRAECALAEIFATEYECQWLRGGACFFDPELLVGAEREDLPETLSREPSFYGIDIGRTNDLTCIVECKRLGDVIWIVGITALRGMHMDDQRDRIVSQLSTGKLARCLIDRGGIGRDLSDHIERKWSSKCKGVDFSQDSKEELAVTFRKELESGRIRVWSDGGDNADQARALRMELTSIKAKPASGGKLSFETPRTVTGHGDRAWAAMLAVAAVTRTQAIDGGADVKPRILTQSFESMRIG